jgi:hypothetical protein
MLLSYQGVCEAAMEENYQQNIIDDPKSGRRCDALLEKRLERIELKQRLKALIVRNKKLTAITPPEKKSLLLKLSTTHARLKREIKLSEIKIENMDEQLIRKGCPGIKF